MNQDDARDARVAAEYKEQVAEFDWHEARVAAEYEEMYK